MGQHRDYFKKEIEKIGEVLARIIAGLIKPTAVAQPDKTQEDAAKTLKTELGIDLETLLNMNDTAAIQSLEAKSFAPANMKALADVLFDLSAGNGAAKILMQQKALALYRYIQVADKKTIYFDISSKIKELER